MWLINDVKEQNIFTGAPSSRIFLSHFSSDISSLLGTEVLVLHWHQPSSCTGTDPTSALAPTRRLRWLQPNVNTGIARLLYWQQLGTNPVSALIPTWLQLLPSWLLLYYQYIVCSVTSMTTLSNQHGISLSLACILLI